ncbi:PREDICTED: uncharacterized protein LOC104737074 [Camelina sativa]|uniref:Uncharacterized protein LOC104737074 n=1 Tax=Camelina sativa TaxID=90675 RepID=A0ABM0VFQ0_CAMSA|nr:PREDICTED: uncharacterized protein LOC104737074 [Camelina sativa]
MGIVAFNWAEEGNNQLTLVMNRDNWANRVISKASWEGQILSGRCQDNDGTWFAISERGRVAFLMSITLLDDQVDPNDGCEFYPIEFLKSNMSPLEFADHVEKLEAGRQKAWSYCLIVADMASNSMVHIRKPNQDEPNVVKQTVNFGVHTLSPYNGLDSLVSARSKDLRLKHLFNEKIGDLGNVQLPQLIKFARDFMCKPEGERVGQDTMYVEMMARHPVSGLENQRFGTTSTTVLAVERTGGVKFFERYLLHGH